MIDSSSYDRILKTALREVEHKIPALVERAFKDLPLDAPVLPYIGNAWPFQHCERAVQKQVVAAALLAKQWFRLEGAVWAQPLLLKAEECYPLLNNHPNGNNYRALLRGEYALHLREVRWNLSRARPFELFCAGKLSSAPSPPP